jgi:hypothetical protein
MCPNSIKAGKGQGTAATKLYNNRSQLQVVVYDATVYGE